MTFFANEHEANTQCEDILVGSGSSILQWFDVIVKRYAKTVQMFSLLFESSCPYSRVSRVLFQPKRGSVHKARMLVVFSSLGCTASTDAPSPRLMHGVGPQSSTRIEHPLYGIANDG